MKTNLTKSLLIFSVIGSMLMLGACRTAQVQNYEAQPVPSNVKSLDQVKKAIKLAGQDLGWIVQEGSGNNLNASLNIRSHFAQVKIPYSTKEYSIVYENSGNLNYNKEDKTIHKNYNGWVQNLNNKIQFRLGTVE